MPELPDLTLFAENLKKPLLGRRVVNAQVFMPAKVSAPAAYFQEKTAGLPLSDIRRTGKELLFDLSGQAAFSVHLMLHGEFSLHTVESAARVSSKVIAVGFDDGQVLVVADYQGLCRVTLNPRPAAAPDALSDAFTYDYFWRALRKAAGKNIKAVLIDQAVVRGIGNAYVDEILYAAKVSPESICGKLPDNAAHALYDTIPAVLLDAIEKLRALTPNAIRGEERSFLKVHNPRLGATAAGEKILTKTVAGKHTYYVAEQKLYL